ncbi:alpha-L-rhamnosidase [Aphanothece sacrum FPU1]|uniref:Alpha-L-rhamnosidase n=2 Tax=Aphanothece sacrum TaxID=1122 RepID=A0A401IC49_APHSA|nr:alpha-L-rhamnosidase [Aphanothece sacrum FPU1]GBF83032.1 alpha-L-rhamnosidase [Aphanothece sacrum FPU3]
MLWLQPLIYQSRLIQVRNFTDPSMTLSLWLSDNYTPAAWTVLIASVVATVIWCMMTAIAKVKGAIDTFQWSLTWWLLGLLPIISIGIALFFFNESSDAQLSLVGFFILNGLILYWLPTAISSPGLFKHIPPGSFLLRRLIG